MDRAEIGAALRAARWAQRPKMTLTSLANLTGVSFGLLGQVERGEQAPDLGLLWHLCVTLDALDGDDFIGIAAHLSEHARLKVDLTRLPDAVAWEVLVILRSAV